MRMYRNGWHLLKDGENPKSPCMQLGLKNYFSPFGIWVFEWKVIIQNAIWKIFLWFLTCYLRVTVVDPYNVYCKFQLISY